MTTSSNMNSSLKIENIDLILGDTKQPKQIFDKISFQIQKNKRTFLIGPNGSGKTLLAKIITGIIKPSQGNIYKINADKQKEIFKNNLDKKNRFISFVPAEFECSNYFTVKQILEIHAINLDSENRSIRKNLEKFMIYELLNTPFCKLSSGEKKRVLIFLSITESPEYLILDEPDSHLDLDIAANLFDLLYKINNIGIFTITHNINFALKYADVLILLNKDHKIIYDGKINNTFFKKLKEVFSTGYQEITDKNNKKYIVP